MLLMFAFENRHDDAVPFYACQYHLRFKVIVETASNTFSKLKTAEQRKANGAHTVSL